MCSLRTVGKDLVLPTITKRTKKKKKANDETLSPLITQIEAKGILDRVEYI